ncbi:MAG TPA: helicase associated domain-containing protein, partial [Verrucomicrobiae bacterium]
RHLHRSGRLREDRLRRLEGLGWEPRARALRARSESWETRFAQLVAFKERHGHCQIPIRWPENPALGVWLSNQRQTAVQGKLSADRLQRLKDLGVQWGRFSHHKWQARFDQLTAYRAQHGHCHVPHDDPALHKLFNWVTMQRTNKRLGKLQPERIRKLDEIGFTWNAGALRISPLENARWDRMFAALVRFKQQHGHTLVPIDHVANAQEELGSSGVPPAPAEGTHADETPALPSESGVRSKASQLDLGRWVHFQRSAFANAKMIPGRQRRLEELGFAWNTLEAKWNQKFEALQTFHRQHGHCRVSTRQDCALAIWVNNQRQRHKDGKLPAAKFQQLDELGFRWDVSGPQGHPAVQSE